jgi:pimeloyl-ACP methyl ester carboxylesterase
VVRRRWPTARARRLDDARAAHRRAVARRPRKLRPLLLQARVRTALGSPQVVYLDLRGHGRSEWGDPASWRFELCADDVHEFCDTLGIAKPVVYGHSLGGFVAMVYAVRHPGCAGALVLQSTMARFDLNRLVEEFRRVGGDGVAAVAERVYGGDSRTVTPEEWAPCWRLFGPWVVGEQERERTVVNQELNEPGLELMRGFDVVDQLGRIDCPTLVCVGELGPATPVAAARRSSTRYPKGSAASRWSRGQAISPGWTRRPATGRS